MTTSRHGLSVPPPHDDAAFDDRAGRLALLAAGLLVEAHAQQFALHLVDLIRLRGGDRGQQARGGIERAVGVVAGEGFLMRPTVAHGEQFVDQTAFALAENLAEYFPPFAVHDHQRSGDIIERLALAGAETGIGQQILDLESPAVAVFRLEFALDERQQAGLEEFQRLADALVVGEGHSVFFLQVFHRPIQRAGYQGFESLGIDVRRLSVLHVFIAQQHSKRHQEPHRIGIRRQSDPGAPQHFHQHHEVMSSGIFDAVARQYRLQRLFHRLLSVETNHPAGRICFSTQMPNHIEIVTGTGKERAAVIKRRSHEPAPPDPHARRVY
jgi:hypothetical protein